MRHFNLDKDEQFASEDILLYEGQGTFTSRRSNCVTHNEAELYEMLGRALKVKADAEKCISDLSRLLQEDNDPKKESSRLVIPERYARWRVLGRPKECYEWVRGWSSIEPVVPKLADKPYTHPYSRKENKL